MPLVRLTSIGDEPAPANPGRVYTVPFAPGVDITIRADAPVILTPIQTELGPALVMIRTSRPVPPGGVGVVPLLLAAGSLLKAKRPSAFDPQQQQPAPAPAAPGAPAAPATAPAPAQARPNLLTTATSALSKLLARDSVDGWEYVEVPIGEWSMGEELAVVGDVLQPTTAIGRAVATGKVRRIRGPRRGYRWMLVPAHVAARHRNADRDRLVPEAYALRQFPGVAGVEIGAVDMRLADTNGAAVDLSRGRSMGRIDPRDL